MFACITLFLCFVVSDITELTESTFSHFINENDHVLVTFYVPWGKQCTSFLQNYAKIAEEFNNLGVIFTKVDCTKEKKIADDNDVRIYPVIKLFAKNNSFKYEGMRNQNDLITFLKKKTGKSLIFIQNEHELTQLTNETFVIAYLPDTESEFFQNFKNASIYNELTFAYANEASLLTKLNSSKTSMLYIYRNGDMRTIPYPKDAELTSLAILEFIEYNSMTSVIELTHQNSKIILQKNTNRKTVLVMIRSASPTMELMKMLNEAVEDFVGKIQIVVIHAKDPDFDVILDLFGSMNFPTFRGIQFGETISKFKPENDVLKKDNIIDFLYKFDNNKLKKIFKEEALPINWNKFPVKVLTRVNFEEIVFDPNNSVFVFFYAPWCGHSRQLKPAWHQLAVKFVSNANLIFAKTDATKNEYELHIPGFPSLYYYSKGKYKGYKSYTEYDGSMNLPNLVKFVNAMEPEYALPVESIEEL